MRVMFQAYIMSGKLVDHRDFTHNNLMPERIASPTLPRKPPNPEP